MPQIPNIAARTNRRRMSLQLRELLRAAAAFAAGGREALLRLSKSGGGAAKLLGQMR